mgnify:FL=1
MTIGVTVSGRVAERQAQIPFRSSTLVGADLRVRTALGCSLECSSVGPPDELIHNNADPWEQRTGCGPDSVER